MSQTTNLLIRINKKLRDDFKKAVESEVSKKTMSSDLREYIAGIVKQNEDKS